MRALDLLLSFRPSNVVARFGARAPLPVLSPRELLAPLRGSTAVLAAFPVPRRALLPGLLRAARMQDAVLGLTLPHPLADRSAPERFGAAVQAAAEAAEHDRPLFLQAGPIPVTQLEDELTQGGVYRCVEAGFTLISLDVSRLGADAPRAVAALAPAVLERELTLEVALPLGGPPPATGPLRRMLDALVSAGTLPQLLRVQAAQVSAGGELEADWVELLRQVVADYGVQLSAVDAAPHGPRAARWWARTGVGKLELSGAFVEGALGAAGQEQEEALRERAASLGLSLGDLLALLEERLPALSEEEALRLEARAFADADDILEGLRLGGTARRVFEALAGQER